MARINTADAGGISVCAFLDMIAWSEGTSAGLHPLTVNDGYDVIVTGADGPEIFADYTAHPFANGRPPKHIRGTLYSSASGRYQHMRKHWAHYRDQLGLLNFGAVAQDRWAIQLIRERRALPDIQEGRIEDAIRKCANIWASFAGAGHGQREHGMETLLQVYDAKLQALRRPEEPVPMPRHWLEEVVTTRR
ncbi:glycoside hydrolase family 24 protein [Kushneria sp. Sum13]|uniref:glycoside hydrolase family 24 protein n=1 Tax=Kushneria sp. Sum13 TaxID=3459196 RepID=UPI0040451B36